MSDELMNKFDQVVDGIPDNGDRLAALRVGDGCYIAMCWFKSYAVPFSASDLLRFVELMDVDNLQ